jgi:hypothetical protein
MEDQQRTWPVTGPAVWNPKALEGFTPRQKEGSDEWEWVKNGDTNLIIPEAPFPTATESLEWQLRYVDEAVPSNTAPELVPKSMVEKIFSLTCYFTRLTYIAIFEGTHGRETEW